MYILSQLSPQNVTRWGFKFFGLLLSFEHFNCLDKSDNLQKDDPKLFAAPASRLPHLGCDMQHHLVTRHSSWLPTNALQTEAMCLLACL